MEWSLQGGTCEVAISRTVRVGGTCFLRSLMCQDVGTWPAPARAGAANKTIDFSLLMFALAGSMR